MSASSDKAAAEDGRVDVTVDGRVFCRMGDFDGRGGHVAWADLRSARHFSR